MHFAALYDDIDRVIKFFLRTPDSGLLFCSAEQPWLIEEVSQQVADRIDYLNGHRIYLLNLEVDEKRSVLDQIHQAIGNQTYYGLVIQNLDDMIEKQGVRLLRELDAAGDQLLAIALPIVIWLNREHLTFFAQEAPKLWINRNSSGVFVNPPEDIQALHRDEDAVRLAIQAAMLNRRLEAGEHSQQDPQHLATEVATALIQVYLDQGEQDKAQVLYLRYKEWIDQGEFADSLRQRFPQAEAEAQQQKSYDVFLSYVEEDYKSVAQPLIQKLRKTGLRVWQDSDKLPIQESLTHSINEGLAQCRHGIVIMSPHYLKKTWTLAEFNSLFARETREGNKVILPIWHDLSYQEVLARHPLLADKFAVSTSKGLGEVANKVREAIQSPEPVESIAQESTQTPNNDSGKDELQNLIAEDQLGQALIEMSAWARKSNPEYLDELIMQSARWHSLRRELENGLILRSDAQVTQNRIRNDLLKLLHQLGNKP